jgi:hypothetical protein
MTLFLMIAQKTCQNDTKKPGHQQSVALTNFVHKAQQTSAAELFGSDFTGIRPYSMIARISCILRIR